MWLTIATWWLTRVNACQSLVNHEKPVVNDIYLQEFFHVGTICFLYIVKKRTIENKISER